MLYFGIAVGTENCVFYTSQVSKLQGSHRNEINPPITWAQCAPRLKQGWTVQGEDAQGLLAGDLPGQEHSASTWRDVLTVNRTTVGMSGPSAEKPEGGGGWQAQH